MSSTQVATFKLGAEEYAVNVAQVQEIVRLSTLTKVPRSPAYVEGVVNLRGRIVPVVDLARRFELAGQERTKATRVIITAVGGRTVGMLVDAVTEVLRLPDDAVDAAPQLLQDGARAEFVTGIGKIDGRLLIMLDLARVLSKEDAAEVAELTADSQDLVRP
jgi:purine-binding chemotaxis protein CheW